MSSADKLQPALIGGVALGIASAVPGVNCLNCFCCALVIGGGLLAAYLYLKDAPSSAEPPYGDAAVLGLMTGAVGAVVSTVLEIPLRMVTMRMGWQDLDQLEEVFEELDIDLPPEVQDMILELFAGELAIGAIVMGFLFSLVLFSIFATLGSLLGVAFFHKKPPAPAVAAAAPPPPASPPPAAPPEPPSEPPSEPPPAG